MGLRKTASTNIQKISLGFDSKGFHYSYMFAMTSWQSKWRGMAARKNGSPQKSSTYTTPSENERTSPKKEAISKGKSFSNRYFSGNVLVLGGVIVKFETNAPCLFEDSWEDSPCAEEPSPLHVEHSDASGAMDRKAERTWTEPSSLMANSTSEMRPGYKPLESVGYWNTLKAKIAMQNVLVWKKTCVKFKLLLDFCGVMVGGFARYYLLCTKLPGVITPEQPEIHWVIQAKNWWLCWDSVINFGMNQASTTLHWTFPTNWWLKSLVQPCGFSAGYVMLALCFQKETVQPEKTT